MILVSVCIATTAIAYSLRPSSPLRISDGPLISANTTRCSLHFDSFWSDGDWRSSLHSVVDAYRYAFANKILLLSELTSSCRDHTIKQIDKFPHLRNLTLDAFVQGGPHDQGQFRAQRSLFIRRIYLAHRVARQGLSGGFDDDAIQKGLTDLKLYASRFETTPCANILLASSYPYHLNNSLLNNASIFLSNGSILQHWRCQ